jgi:hypothetical protein
MKARVGSDEGWQQRSTQGTRKSRKSPAASLRDQNMMYGKGVKKVTLFLSLHLSIHLSISPSLVPFLQTDNGGTDFVLIKKSGSPRWPTIEKTMVLANFPSHMHGTGNFQTLLCMTSKHIRHRSQYSF